MSIVADAVRAVLIPFLMFTGALLVLLVCQVLLLHWVRGLASSRRQRLLAQYRPLVTAALHSGNPDSSLERLRTVPQKHRAILAQLVLEPLRAVKGGVAERARGVASLLGLVARWESDLRHRRWWMRADAAHALGLVRDRSAVGPLVAALDDPYEEVRAAALEALGRIADPTAVPALVARLSEGSRQQRVRLVEALQQFGSSAVTPLLDHGRAHPGSLAAVAELLGSIEAPAAIATLLEWSSHDREDVRAAAVRAIGAIGADDRAYYHLLRALTDGAPDVRAAAAWALGRSGREDAASYLASRLEDEWIVAAQAARALRALGAPGRQALEAAAALEHGELARQVLWESNANPAA